MDKERSVSADQESGITPAASVPQIQSPKLQESDVQLTPETSGPSVPEHSDSSASLGNLNITPPRRSTPIASSAEISHEPAPPPQTLPHASHDTGPAGQDQRPAQVLLDPAQSTDWALFFVDDFDVDTLALPASPWSTMYPWGPGGLDGEREYYTRYDNPSTPCDTGGPNHIFGGSAIKLTAKYQPGNYEVWSWPNNVFTRSCKPYLFTSGMLYSKQPYLYGYFEIRCKLPANGAKLWPAFWIYAQDDPLSYREIDIFEFDSPGVANKMLTNIHIAQAFDFGRVHQDPPPHPTNDYPGVSFLNGDLTNDFHTYGVEWLPNSITWYFDGLPVRMTAGHSPPRPMHVILDLAIAGWDPAPSQDDLPLSYEIDYVKIFRRTRPEMLWAADNSGSNTIGLWQMKPGDRFFIGDFDGDGKSELLAVSNNGWCHLMRWDGSNWQYAWGNNGSHKIAVWSMNSTDQFVVGDFDGDGKSEILAIATNGWSQMMKWDGSDWQYAWGNNGSHKIAVWSMNSTDQFVVGDFDGDGKSEILAIATNGWSQMMKWDGSDWQYAWGNNGSHKIAVWSMNSTDQFVVGDFDGDGKSELVAFSSSGWSQMMKWDGANWQYAWGNSGSGQIAVWNMKPDDRLIVGDFDGDGKSELLAFSCDVAEEQAGVGWSQMMKWDGANWKYAWGNSGGSTIHRWFMKPTDQYLAGKLFNTHADLIAISANGWEQVMTFTQLP